jgi:hypothetical protein
MSLLSYDPKNVSVKNNVVRWISSGHVPFEDMLQRMVDDGFITREQLHVSITQRETDVELSLARYRKAQENHVHSDEELYEMRAAFGKGAVVVNAITGKRTQL